MESQSPAFTSRPRVHQNRDVQSPPLPSPHALQGLKARSEVTAIGTGLLEYAGLAVTRRRGDPVGDDEGIFVYLRDLDRGDYWSATRQPNRVEPAEYEVQWQPKSAHFRRRDGDVVVNLDVMVDDSDVEFRRCTIANLGDGVRRIELSSYLEWVLQDAAADEAHPAFSKLFVETRLADSFSAIIAKRRPRDPHQRTLCGAHWIAAVEGAIEGALEYETSRTHFIGRGRDRRAPQAMTNPTELSATVGPVLDPVASLRRRFVLGQNESASITYATTARATEGELLELLARSSSNAPQFNRVTWSHRKRSTSDRISLNTGLGSDLPDEWSSAPVERRFDPAHASRTDRDFQPLNVSADEARAVPASFAEPLTFFNGLGGFTAEGDEYVIRLQTSVGRKAALPPQPWSHIVANRNAGFIATETGAGYTWTANSRENRLTHWSNDPVSDPHSEALFLRDYASLEFWSPTAGPAGAAVAHEVRYGFGRVTYRHCCCGLEQEVAQFLPLNDAVKISRVTVHNLRKELRQLDACFYSHLALGNGSTSSSRQIRAWFDEESSALFAANPGRELSARIAFAALIVPLATSRPEYTANRREFLGPLGDLREPAAVRSGAPLGEQRGEGPLACFALRQQIHLKPGETQQFWVLLGEAESEEGARELIARYSQRPQVEAASGEVARFWQDLLAGVQIDTPSPAMNLMVNGWLPYQNIACRMWGRSAFYQSGGAFGFRDQLQDAAALIYHDATFPREQIRLHASNQFVEGDVLHWWHPPASRGIRTRFADDLLWLPLLTCEYAATTGDRAIWQEEAPYVTGPPLDQGEQERFFTASDSGEVGSIYEHCCRAVDRSLSLGAHGLPLFGCGDWNDGMNRVGQEGRGESVWMGFFLHQVLKGMIPVCREQGDDILADRYEKHQQRLRSALDTTGWDGGWYRRAYFDDGEPLGTALADECQIDALVQAWAVLSGAGEEGKARQGLEAVDRRLVRANAGLIQLLDPPFDCMTQDPGYIKGYLPGIRENGGQYTHGVLWFVRAMAEVGRGSRAVELLDMLNPIHHARTEAEVATYQAEPYVVAADVYSQPPHVGRAGWTWYTGSAGWMFRVAVESILGLRVHEGRELRIRPSISQHWPSCRLIYRPAGVGAYEITIENPRGRETGLAEAWLDGAPVPIVAGAAHIPMASDGGNHQVRLVL